MENSALTAGCAGLLLVILAQRLWIAGRHGLGFDSYGHLYMAVAVNSQKAGPYGKIAPQVLHGGYYRQPFLFHWVVGRLGKARLLRLAPLLNPLFESAFLVGATALLLASDVPAAAVLGALLLYGTTPLWATAVGGLGMRIAFFSPRLMSELTVNASLLVTAFQPGSSWLQFALQTFFVWASLSVSKFGVQAVVLLLVPVALLAGGASLLLAIVAAFALAVALSRGAFLESLASQLRHLRWYSRLVDQGGGERSGPRNSLRQLLRTGSGPAGARALTFARRLIYGNSWTGIFFRAPVVPLAGLAMAAGAGRVGDNSVLEVAVWVSLAVFALTNLRRLLFLGESERYLNHCALPFCLIAGSAALHDSAFAALLLASAIYGIAFWYAEERTFGSSRTANSGDREERLLEHLKDREPTAIASVPYHALNPWRVMLETPHRVFFPIISDSPEAAVAREYEVPYPFPDIGRLDELHKNCGVRLLVVDRAQQAIRFPGWVPPPGWQELPLSTPELLVLERLPVAPAEAPR